MIEPLVITIEVAGEPMGQPRGRAVAYVPKKNNPLRKHRARVFDSGEADGWKHAVKTAALPKRPPRPHLGPVRCDVTWYFSRPAYMDKGRMYSAEAQPHIAKPDRDNLDKCVLDALTELKDLGFWRDDAQVYGGTIFKYYAARGAAPGAVIRITLERTP